MSLKAVITQVLVKTPDGRGRRAILEILVSNRAIAKLISADQTHQIPSQLQTGKDQGMQLLDQALLDSIAAKQIDPNDAIRFANDKKKFQRYVTDTDLVPTLALGSGPEE
jgi:twitching motility protein PilT